MKLNALPTNKPKKHQPSILSEYLRIHDTVMSRYRDLDFVESDNLEVKASQGNLFMDGQIFCSGQIVIEVTKCLRVLDKDDDPEVQTIWYAYNVSVKNVNNIFRYDNQHPDSLHPGHKDEHHRHDFDWKTGQELSSGPQWVGVGGWPTLGEVIQQALDWYWEHYEYLVKASTISRL